MAYASGCDCLRGALARVFPQLPCAPAGSAERSHSRAFRRDRPARLRLDNDLVVATVGEINLDCAKARNVEFDILRMEVAGNIEAPNLVDERPAPDILDIDFASRRLDRKLPSTLGTTRPSSIATVTVPIVPWPHIGRQPLTSMKRTPTSQSSRDEGYGIVRT